MVLKRIRSAAAYVVERAELGDRLEEFADREIDTDRRLEFVRTIESRERAARQVHLGLAGVAVANVGRQVCPLGETSVRKEGQSDVAHVAAGTRTTLQHVEALGIAGTVSVVGVRSNDTVSDRVVDVVHSPLETNVKRVER